METTQAAELAQYLDGTVQELSHAHVAGLSFAEQVEILDLLAGFEERVAALRSTIIREADLTAVKSTDLAPLIHATSRVTAREAAAQVRLAKDLETYPLLRQAWTDGTLSQAQLRGIIRGLRRIPITLGPAQLDTAQQELLQWHDQLDPQAYEHLAAHLGTLLDPHAADQAEARKIELDARTAHATREILIADDHAGSTLIHGRVPRAIGEAFRAQLDALIPTAQSYTDAGEPLPSMAARRADALEEWIARLAGDHTLPSKAGDRPVIYLTMTATEADNREARATLLNTGEQLSAAETRRLACDARFARLVLNADGAPLDLGQTRRLFTGPLRRALAARDRGCAFPGCDAPAIACEGHHINPWQNGGETKLTNAALLCPAHHRLVEPDPSRPPELQWQVHPDPDTMLPAFTPPTTMPGDRRPRLHHRYLLQREVYKLRR